MRNTPLHGNDPEIIHSHLPFHDKYHKELLIQSGHMTYNDFTLTLLKK